MERLYGFEPVFDDKSKILILGSFPSVISRRTNFYYGNKQNRFWKTLAAAFDCPLPLSNDEKRALVLSHGVALWDIVKSCTIKGSMDSDIRDYEVVDLSVILSAAKIERILLDGGKAYEIFLKAYPALETIARRLPSTSSANVRFDQEVWLKELKGCFPKVKPRV